MNPWKDATADNADELIGGQEFPDAGDMIEVLEAFGVHPLQGKVIEIGCGVGRLAQICGEYVGYDVSPAFVDICRSKGIEAHLLPTEFQTGNWLLIAHVFCHIPRDERLEYLALDIAPNLVVDIIPGDGFFGYPVIYETNPDEFPQDLAEAGWRVTESYERPDSEFRHKHRYYRCER